MGVRKIGFDYLNRYRCMIVTLIDCIGSNPFCSDIIGNAIFSFFPYQHAQSFLLQILKLHQFLPWYRTKIIYNRILSFYFLLYIIHIEIY
jgi:hypothetical protein